MAKGIFISDLHLFCNRSKASDFQADFHEAAGSADTFVFGGDIVDFKWSQLGSVENTIAAGCEWVKEFVTSYPDCQFYYLLGNHDCAPEYVARLEAISEVHSNFKIHPHWLRIKDTVFLHGDVCNKMTTQEELVSARARWAVEQPRGRLANLLYAAAVGIRVHRLLGWLAHPPFLITKRLLYYLSDIGQGPETGLTDVYFGHTHHPVHGFEKAGIRFHNCGSPIKGLPFRIIEFSE